MTSFFPALPPPQASDDGVENRRGLGDRKRGMVEWAATSALKCAMLGRLTEGVSGFYEP